MQRNIKPYGKIGQMIEYLPSVEPKGIIFYSHGLGEIKSKGPIDIIERNEIPQQLKNGMEVPYIVLAPQLDGTSWSRAVNRSIFELIDKYGPYEKHKTGVSLGGMNTVAAATHAWEWFGNKPGYFKTYYVVCGKTSNEMPVSNFSGAAVRWAHGLNDSTITFKESKAQEFTSRLAAAGIDSTLITYAGVGHPVWNNCYNEDYWPWLAAHTGIPQPELEDPIDRQYYLGGKIHFVGASGKVYLVNVNPLE